MNSRTSLGGVVFGVVSGKNLKLSPRLSVLSSSCLSPVGAIIGVLRKVVYPFILMFIVTTSLSCSFPFVPVETKPDGYLVGKELVILLFECIVGKCFVVFYVFSFPPTVYVGT